VCSSDLKDLPAMAMCAASACPSDAARGVRDSVDIVFEAKGGAGCFRELTDLLLASRSSSQSQ